MKLNRKSSADNLLYSMARTSWGQVKKSSSAGIPRGDQRTDLLICVEDGWSDLGNA
ncbi:MAG: hypothetical protein GY819_00165 [Planctomycetaceae bacterium]|nr:hypothetical protein [Planctomycetaceae bacterium]MCP4461192.1 hypothetical protein [Planctomycetaceae bacterium]